MEPSHTTNMYLIKKGPIQPDRTWERPLLQMEHRRMKKSRRIRKLRGKNKMMKTRKAPRWRKARSWWTKARAWWMKARAWWRKARAWWRKARTNSHQPKLKIRIKWKLFHGTLSKIHSAWLVMCRQLVLLTLKRKGLWTAHQSSTMMMLTVSRTERRTRSL